jgi:hypothetical protein
MLPFKVDFEALDWQSSGPRSLTPVVRLVPVEDVSANVLLRSWLDLHRRFVARFDTCNALQLNEPARYVHGEPIYRRMNNWRCVPAICNRGASVNLSV